MTDDPIESAFAKLGCKRLYNKGDLVRWGGEMFEIEGYIYEAGRSAVEEFEEITYSMTRLDCDGTFNDFAEVYQDDESLRLVCRSEFADEFIAQLGMEGGREMIAASGGGNDKGSEQSKGPVKSTRQLREEAEFQRRRDYRAWIDAKLDEFNTANDDEGRAIMREMKVRSEIFSAGGGVE